ncbi:endoplasmic reticulum membrane protein complex subunit 7-like [Haliotis asinina]|uniref:endoplasmic reticulum membrane protein complex subunit 7-like n=1 Tax=Haliotis asinina TaxID=109174 RepID=UPI00353275E4
MDGWCSLVVFSYVLCFVHSTDVVETNSSSNFKIEGKVEILSSHDKSWMSNTRILVDGDDYVAYLRSDGSFVVNGLPSGSFIVEVANPTYLFEAARVDITSKGKIRARKVNHLQPNNVRAMPYPLEFRERGKANYFQAREQWRVQDFLFHPMVLTMVLPLALIMVLPKMLNAADPETQKEMQTQMSALNSKPNMPDMSEMFTNFFGGGDARKPIKSKQSSKRKS